jgi:hypothetical protein
LEIAKIAPLHLLESKRPSKFPPKYNSINLSILKREESTISISLGECPRCNKLNLNANHIAFKDCKRTKPNESHKRGHKRAIIQDNDTNSFAIPNVQSDAFSEYTCNINTVKSIALALS